MGWDSDVTRSVRSGKIAAMPFELLHIYSNRSVRSGKIPAMLFEQDTRYAI